MIELTVLSQEGKIREKITLDKKVFDGKINEAIVHQVVTAYLNNQRQGTASTKTRKDVRGGGKKPWRQKGTGRARVGSIRSPLWRGGGVVFGPHPRSFNVRLPKKIKNTALKFSLNSKLNEGAIKIVDNLLLSQPKTKEIKKILDNLKVESNNKILIVTEPNLKLYLAARNLPDLDIFSPSSLNTYELLRHKIIIFTKKAFLELTKRLKNA